jgi:hypothetical protein
VLDLALARSAWKTTVTAHLGTMNDRVSWSRTPLPAVDNIHELAHLEVFSEVDTERLLFNDSAPTALERADGNWGPAVRKLSGKIPGDTVTTVTAVAGRVGLLSPTTRQP